jgi:hypothetical protein
MRDIKRHRLIDAVGREERLTGALPPAGVMHEHGDRCAAAVHSAPQEEATGMPTTQKISSTLHVSCGINRNGKHR